MMMMIIGFWWCTPLFKAFAFPGSNPLSYSVMVITKDPESFDPGSSPGRTFIFVSGQNKSFACCEVLLEAPSARALV